MRDTALLKKYVHDAVHGRGGNSDCAESRETRSGNADCAVMRINYRPAHSCRLQANIESHVRRKERACPSVTFCRYQADYSKSGNGATCSRAADHKCETARFERRNIPKFAYGTGSLRTLQNLNVCRGIAACECGGHDSAIGKGQMNFFIAAQRVFGCNHDTGAPYYAARRAA